ncbi:MAG: c-type cytochrome biogenesis protein CcmI, partial [Alphaproteobacteria bacterium]|nr:c-type cytochrome biogenesis protein CcmI [Alphaproteobacteria bacterium]
MTLWIVIAVLVAGALAWIAWPLLRPRTVDTVDGDIYDAAVYLDQLEELERDRARGLIDDSQAAAARTEIERRLLAAGRAGRLGTGTATRRPGFAVVVAILVPILALSLYLELGSPGLPNQPFAERLPAAPPQNSIVTAARERLAEAERRAEADPGNPDAWFDLGRFRLVSGDVDGAAAALARALETSGGRSDIASAYGEALSRQADGLVTPEARRAFETALAGNPGDPRARYFLALADFQEGREQSALEAWSVLARSAPANAPWLPTVIARISETARTLGENPADWIPRAPRGPSSADIAAAQDMTADERAGMIRGMVEGLAARLEEEPDDVEGWRRLARARGVLGEHDAAAEVYAKALALDPDHPETLLNAAVAAGRIGDAEDARRRLARLRDLLPGDVGVRASLDAAITQIDSQPQ